MRPKWNFWISIGIILLVSASFSRGSAETAGGRQAAALNSAIQAETLTECVYCFHNAIHLDPRVLAVDSQGYPHIAYDGSYSWKDSSGWHSEFTAPAQGSASSLALDQNGIAHIVYIQDDAAGTILGYAYRDSSGWHPEQVYQRASIFDTEELSPALVLDASNRPHVAFIGNKAGDNSREVLYAFRDQAGWHSESTQVAGGPSNPVGPVMLALDSSQNPHIVADGASGAAHFYWTGSQWVYENLAAAGFNGAPLALLTAANGRVYLIYSSQNAVRYSYWFAGAWLPSAVDIDSSTGADDLSAALDPSGSLRLIYWSKADGILKYARQDAGGWIISSFSAVANPAQAASLAVDANGISQIVAISQDPADAALNTLQYVQQDGSGWLSPAAVAQSDFIYRISAFTVDGSGVAQAAYKSRRYGLVYASRAGGTWVNTLVDPSLSAGNFLALATGTDGGPHILYTLETGGDYFLSYAYRVNSSWQTAPVLSAVYNNSDDRPSLALDGANHPHFVVDELSGTDHHLNFYSYNGSVWNSEMLDSLDASGVFDSATLKFDDAGFPHLFYKRTQSGASTAVYRYQDGSGWHSETVESGVDFWEDGKMALDSNGRPHVVYLKASGSVPVYAFRDSDGWHKEELTDYAGNPFLYVYLTLGDTDIPFVALQDAQTKLVTSLTRKNAAWQQFNVTEISWIGPIGIATGPWDKPVFLIPREYSGVEYLQIMPYENKAFLPLVRR